MLHSTIIMPHIVAKQHSIFNSPIVVGRIHDDLPQFSAYLNAISRKTDLCTVFRPCERHLASAHSPQQKVQHKNCCSAQKVSVLSKRHESDDDMIVIKKYANRRLYNTSASTYVTLDDLAQMVKDGEDFVVKDAKSGEDITRSVLTQIIFEEENKGENLLPINFLRQLIRFYGDSMQAVVPSYLEYSIDSLSREQEKFQKQIADAFGGTTFPGMEDQVRQNMAMFQQTMQMFNPFSGTPETPGTTQEALPPAQPANDGGKDELKGLQDQLKAMQAQIDKIAKSSS